MAHDWKSRIVGTAEVPPDELIANPKNFRRHPSRQRRVLGAVLDDVGFVTDVIVNRRTGRILDGHLRVELAIKAKQPTVPVKYVDLSEKEESLVLATFDPVGELAYLDLEAMEHLRDLVAPDASAPVAELLEELAPPSLPDDDEEDEGAPAPRPEADDELPDDDLDEDDEDDVPDWGFTLYVFGETVPLTPDEFRRLDAAYEEYVDTHGMTFGLFGWLCREV